MSLNLERLHVGEEACLTRLPGDILAKVYQRLDKKEDRQAFFGCCKTVRWSPQV